MPSPAELAEGRARQALEKEIAGVLKATLETRGITLHRHHPSKQLLPLFKQPEIILPSDLTDNGDEVLIIALDLLGPRPLLAFDFAPALLPAAKIALDIDFDELMTTNAPTATGASGSQVDGLTRINAALERQVDELTRHNGNLTARLQTSAREKAELARLRAQIADQSSRNEMLMAQNASLELRITEFSAERKILDGQIAQLAENNDDLRSQLDQPSDDIILKRGIGGLKTTNTILRRQKRDGEERISRLEGRIADIQYRNSQLVGHGNNWEEIHRDILRLEAENERLAQSHGVLTEKIEELEERSANQTTLTDAKVLDLEHSNGGLRSANAKLTASNRRRDETISQLEGQIASLQEQNSQLVGHGKSWEEIHGDILRLEAENTGLRKSHRIIGDLFRNLKKILTSHRKVSEIIEMASSIIIMGLKQSGEPIEVEDPSANPDAVREAENDPTAHPDAIRDAMVAAGTDLTFPDPDTLFDLTNPPIEPVSQQQKDSNVQFSRAVERVWRLTEFDEDQLLDDRGDNIRRSLNALSSTLTASIEQGVDAPILQADVITTAIHRLSPLLTDSRLYLLSDRLVGTLQVMVTAVIDEVRPFGADWDRLSRNLAIVTQGRGAGASSVMETRTAATTAKQILSTLEARKGSFAIQTPEPGLDLY